MAINIWLTPNLVVLCHSVGNEELMNFTMCCRFIYFATVLRPEYFVMLLPVNVAMNECRIKLACVLLREDAISTCLNEDLTTFDCIFHQEGDVFLFIFLASTP